MSARSLAAVWDPGFHAGRQTALELLSPAEAANSLAAAAWMDVAWTGAWL